MPEFLNVMGQCLLFVGGLIMFFILLFILLFVMKLVAELIRMRRDNKEREAIAKETSSHGKD